MFWQWERVGKVGGWLWERGPCRAGIVIWASVCSEGLASAGDASGLGGPWCVFESGLLSGAFDRGRRHWWDGLQEGGSSLPACRDPVFACQVSA